MASSATVAVGVAVLLAAAALMFPRIQTPPHLLGHPLVYDANLIDADAGAELNVLIRSMASDELGFPTNIAADLKTGVSSVKHEHIGEARPIEADGTCAHPFLVPDKAKRNCILPQRVDVGRHFVQTGGPEAIREPYADMVSRVSSFGRYMFDLKSYPVVEKLFSNERFQGAAQAICPHGQKLLDPFQFNFIMQVPGQTVALHLDAPYFLGATRWQVPQWLLVVMTFSGLFQDNFIHQVQTVGYLHQWRPSPGDKPSGQFLFYNSSSAQPFTVPALPLSGSAVDGSKSLHAAGVFRPGSLPPKMDKDRDNALFYVGDEQWELRSAPINMSKDTIAGKPEVLRRYSSSDLRITIVYRARCFADEAARDKYHRVQKEQPEEEMLDLESHILPTLAADLFSRGLLKGFDSASDALDGMDRLDLALLLIETYIKYPLPDPSTALIPFNYCALPRVMGSWEAFASKALSPLCGLPSS